MAERAYHRDQARRYTGLAMLFHWLIALGIAVNVALAWTWPYVADENVRPLIDNHKSIGITVLGLAILRLLWRATHTPPPFPTDYQRWEARLAHITHFLLYAVMFVMPLSGWIMDSAYKDAAAHPMYFWHTSFVWPRIGFILALDPATKKSVHDGFGAVHYWTAWVLYALFALHVAGALKHQWLDGKRELQRMLPWGRA